MKRTLILNDTLSSYEQMMTIQLYFPETANSFKQRKEFQEFYFTETLVEITPDKLHDLTVVEHCKVELVSDEIIISF